MSARERKVLNKDNIEKVFDLAANLSRSERQQLLDRLALEGQTAKDGSERDLDMWSIEVSKELSRRHGDQEGAMYGPQVAKRLLGAPIAWRPVQSFMEHSTLIDLKVVERQSMYAMLAQLLVQHAQYVARKSGAPLSLKLISNCTGNIADLFEDSFPDYLAAGFAPIVARQLCYPR